MQQQENYKWAKFIWSNALQKSTKILTLGIDFNTVSTIDNGTEFYCLGRKMHGTIRIQHQDWSNEFRITITPDDVSEKPIVTENVMLQDLVFVIIQSIEHYYDCRRTRCEEYENVA